MGQSAAWKTNGISVLSDFAAAVRLEGVVVGAFCELPLDWLGFGDMFVRLREKLAKLVERYGGKLTNHGIRGNPLAYIMI